MNRTALMLVLLSLMIHGCVAHVTPGGTYLEPLPAAIFVGPPFIVAPPPHITVRPLPPVVVVPKRHVYYYGNLYYGHWDDRWYYGKHERGPWHRLPRDHYPKKYKFDHGGDGKRGRGRHR